MGRNATNAVTAQYPSLQPNTLNNLPVIRFDGIDDRLNSDFLISTGIWRQFPENDLAHFYA
jgi:hypothetical protein